ncbi:MAG: TRAP transporter small permease [Rhodobiaceae bacterium]|nr:TRAP transporter small permease [Rhodobiaceae bacterium]
MPEQSALGAFYEKILDATGTLVGLLIALIAVMISIEVAMRNFGQGGISWLNETIEFAIYAGTFAAAPWVLHQGAHIRVDIVLTLLPRPVALAVEILADLSGAVICLALLYYGGVSVADAWSDNTIQYKNLAWPEWALFAVVPLFTGLMAIEFVLRARRALATGSAERAEPATEGF